MRLFGRKRNDDEVEERCTHCGEPVPDGAARCMMCGVDLRPFRGKPSSEELESRETDFPAA
jgi:zinc ribbon protein